MTLKTKFIAVSGALMLCFTGTVAAHAQQSAGVPVASAPIDAHGDARAPYAWIDMCKRIPAECRFDSREPERVELTQKLWKQIVAVNRDVNREIEPVTDQEHWGVVDRWDIPEDGKGDCEDYVLLKRKRLAALGLPRRAMLVTVVIDEENAGHAVLTIRTDRGDFILDNKRNAILPWGQTGYVYVKRESATATGWASLGGVATSSVASLR